MELGKNSEIENELASNKIAEKISCFGLVRNNCNFPLNSRIHLLVSRQVLAGRLVTLLSVLYERLF